MQFAAVIAGVRRCFFLYVAVAHWIAVVRSWFRKNIDFNSLASANNCWRKYLIFFLFSQLVFSLSDIKLSSGKITFHNFPWKIFAKVQCCVVLRCNGVTKLETCSSLTWSYNSLEYKYFLYTAIKIFLGACVWIFLMHKITDLYYSYRDTTFSFACDTCTLVGGSSTFTFTFTLNKMIKKATICIVWWCLG